MAHKKRDKELEAWIASMGPDIEAFIQSVPADVAVQLNYSIESLDVLEAWLLTRYHDSDEAIRDLESPLFGGMSRYIGETFRKIIGGYWSIERRPKYAYHGMPILIDSSKTPRCPHFMATTAVHRRKSTLFSSMLRNNLKSQAARQRRAGRTVESANRAFADWLAAMDEVLAWLFAQMPAAAAAKLDYSLDSLDVLTAWLLERYPAGQDTDDMLAALDWLTILDPATVPPLLDAASRYVGEVLCKNVGGRWWHDATLEEWGLWGELPQIIEFSPEPAPTCPLMYVTDAIKERKADAISSAFRSIAAEIPELRAHYKAKGWL